ncbi:MAG: hypothetical protein ACYDB9_13360 [Gammaproteobacteria bacterium]
MKRLTIMLLLTLVICPVYGSGNANPTAGLKRAIMGMQLAPLSAWGYSRTTVLNGVTYVERFDPLAPKNERWSLISINGQPPTQKQREKYASGDNPQTDKGFDTFATGSQQGISGVVPGDLRYEPALACMAQSRPVYFSQNATTIIYHFRPRCPKFWHAFLERSMANVAIMRNNKSATKDAIGIIREAWLHLDGEVTVSKKRDYIESIELYNPTLMSFSIINVRKYYLQDNYAPLYANGPAVLVYEKKIFQGKALFFESIDKSQTATITGFSELHPKQ